MWRLAESNTRRERTSDELELVQISRIPLHSFIYSLESLCTPVPSSSNFRDLHVRQPFKRSLLNTLVLGLLSSYHKHPRACMAEIHHGTLRSLDLTPEPDLHPLYPSPNQISPLLSANSGLNPSQKAELVSHCLSRACLFGDLNLFQYLLCDKQAQSYVDLDSRDDDGLGLLSQTIQGFGAESERDVEREECVHLLVAQGADVHSSDQAGWTPLHHAALLAPPTLVSHLMTHGCSPFSVTHRNLTPLDIVTAHTLLPGREDIAILLEEAMRSEGWSGGRMEQRRRALDERIKRRDGRKGTCQNIANIIEVPPQWWGDDGSELSFDESDSEEDDDSNDEIYTPSLDFTSMLAWSPQDLHDIFEAIITNFRITAQNTEPANVLYLMARFACLMCDLTWLEDLIIGATDVIEEKFFVSVGSEFRILTPWPCRIIQKTSLA